MNPQNIIVIGCLLTSLLAYLLVLWSGSRIGHGVVIAAVSCLGLLAMERHSERPSERTLAELNPHELAVFSTIKSIYLEKKRAQQRP